MKGKWLKILALTGAFCVAAAFGVACGETENETSSPAPETEIKGETLADETAWKQAISDTAAKTNATLTYTAATEERRGEYFIEKKGSATAKVADGKLYQITTGTSSGYHPSEDGGETVSYQDEPFMTETYIGFVDNVAIEWYREDNQEQWDCYPYEVYGQEITATVGGLLSTIDVFLAPFTERYVDFKNVDGTYVLESSEGNESGKVELKFVGGLLYSYVMEVTDTDTYEGQTSTESMTISIMIVYDNTTVDELPRMTYCAHSFTDYVPNDDATCTKDGTKTAWCDYGCGETDTVADEGSAGHKYDRVGVCGCGDVKVSEGLDIYINIQNICVVGGIGTCKDTEIFIPDEYKGVPVTEISSRAFADCNSFTAITIPDSVTRIAWNAFQNCDSLTTVTIGNGVTQIEDYAFHDCDKLKSVTISDNSRLTSIWEYAFSECIELTEFTLGENSQLTSIGDSAFYLCSNLPSIVLPDTVTSIGEKAFWHCYSLQYTTKDGLKYLGNEKNPYAYLVIAYIDSANNASVTVEKGCKLISDGVFANSSLQKIIIADSVTGIGAGAFNPCYDLTEITFEGTVEQWNSIKKGADWNKNTLVKEVICNGGSVAL